MNKQRQPQKKRNQPKTYHRPAKKTLGSNKAQTDSPPFPLETMLTMPYAMPFSAMQYLQRKVGNRAVQGLLLKSAGTIATIQRLVTPPAVHHSGKDMYDMTLNDFYLFAQNQLDWFNSPDVSNEKRRRLRTLLGFAERAAVLSGCGEMKISKLVDLKLVRGHITLNEKIANPLESYGKAVEDGVVESPTNDPKKALQWGKEIKKLYNNPAIAAVLSKIMREQDLEELINRRYVDDFIKYVNRGKPRLEAEEGMEIQSYLALRSEGKDPVQYLGTRIASRVKNFHRFERTALDRLVRNFAKANLPNDQRKPLTLILHTATDHNGAFHRDPFLTSVITNNNILALMIEGKETLADVQSELPDLAKRYGKHGKIDQVMFAGHGNARMMELGSKSGENIDLDANKADTDKLFDEILRNMSDDPSIAPHRRIVFNACLTNSNAVTIPLDASNEANAGKQVRDHIAANASLATYLQQRIRKQGLTNITALGANGSISQVKLLDSSDGLDIIASYDPAVTADKLEYVRKGTEPGGVMRAVLECWAGVGVPDPSRRQKDCFKAMQDRTAASPGGDWSETIIHTLFDIILKSYRTNGEMIRRMDSAASTLDELKFESEARVKYLKFGGLTPGGGLAAETTNIFKPLPTTTTWGSNNWVPLVINEVWMRHDNAKRTDFMAALSPFNCQTAADFLDIKFITPELPHLLPLKASPSKEELLLAFRAIAEDPAEAHTRSFLLKVIGPGNQRFPSALNVSNILQGNPSEHAVLVALGLIAGSSPSPVAPPPATKRANLDLDGDGINETYVTPLRDVRGKTAKKISAFERPDTSSTPLSRSLGQGKRLYIIGETGNFYAIHNPFTARQVVFVEKTDVTLT